MLDRNKLVQWMLVILAILFSYLTGTLLLIGDYGLAAIPAVAAWGIWAYLYVTLSRKIKR